MLPNYSTLFVPMRFPVRFPINVPESAAHPAPRFALETTLAQDGVFDGAWWPRSRDVRAELPDLITALSAHLGAILRVGLDVNTWDAIPHHLTINGHVVDISWVPASDGTMSVALGHQDHLILLVVPPYAAPSAARAAMATAAHTGNSTPAAQILAATGIIPVAPDVLPAAALRPVGEPGGAACPA